MHQSFSSIIITFSRLTKCFGSLTHGGPSSFVETSPYLSSARWLAVPSRLLPSGSARVSLLTKLSRPCAPVVFIDVSTEHSVTGLRIFSLILTRPRIFFLAPFAGLMKMLETLVFITELFRGEALGVYSSPALV